ncbi:low molecular weight protein-tyrosine-phosphatase [Burkholderia cepacia]|uniref:low molecular weight protein-tyrosine-phosphatase n=1 Tax=Burkholderia cepacia TaxID=292 RepID=UPI0012960C39|nr:low molecular weight protein-tyrosine-phosphatase [Burkholderia cepacia]QFS40569.1 Low molecular weight phosphotyrosine protein phosphata [Burkholderia cepacia]
MIERILVICEGNRCRSPIAQGLLQRSLPDVAVASAGLSATDGDPLDPIVAPMLKARGIDLSTHLARRVTRQMCSDSDLILAMELTQLDAIERLLPVARGRVFRLADALAADIPDPYRRSRRQYDYAMTLIERGVREWAARIDNLNSRGQPGKPRPKAEGRMK